jgi:hypothetical protein
VVRHGRSSVFWPRDGCVKILANLSRQKIIDFPVPRDGGALPGASIDVDGMAAALTEQFAALALEVPDEIDSLHAVNLKGSRITSSP